MLVVLEESEKLIMLELREFQARRLLTGQKKSNNRMLELNVDYLTSEKLVTNIFHILWNAKPQQLVQLS